MNIQKIIQGTALSLAIAGTSLFVGYNVGSSAKSQQQRTERDFIAQVYDLNNDGLPDLIDMPATSYGSRHCLEYKKGFGPSRTVESDTKVEFLDENVFYKHAMPVLMRDYEKLSR